MENPVKENLQKVLDLFQKGTQTKKALKYLGTSGYVVESTASAFFLFLNEENFLQGMEILLDIGGDTDTIGAIYGAIFGAYYGIEKFPKDLLEKISIKEKIQKIAQDLINSC
jgi:ADP-ribosyl-[dinitrogen reductase] hydrolase